MTEEKVVEENKTKTILRSRDPFLLKTVEEVAEEYKDAGLSFEDSRDAYIHYLKQEIINRDAANRGMKTAIKALRKEEVNRPVAIPRRTMHIERTERPVVARRGGRRG